MIKKSKVKKGVGFGTILSVCLMLFCLTYLTSLNFFLYPDSDKEVITQNTSPSGPTEEKASNSGFSLAEEIHHEDCFVLRHKSMDDQYLHHIAEAEKLQIVHPELLLRPPRA